MSRIDVEALRALRLGASNPEDEWAWGIASDHAARIAEQVIADQSRPEGVGATGSPEPRDWSGLNRGHLNGGD